MRSCCSALGVFSVLALCGCGNEEIQVYQVARERAEAAPPSARAGSPPHSVDRQSLPRIRYALPAGWKESPAEGMRVAGFVIPGNEVPDATVAVIPMSQMRGRESEMALFWGQQIGMQLEGGQAAPQAERIPMPGGTNVIRMFNLASVNPVIDGRHKARILAAILDRGDVSWIIKLAGEDRLVAGQREAFLGFLKSISFDPGAGGGL